MAANRKKGKKPQSSNQGKSSNKQPSAETAALASDKAVAEPIVVEPEPPTPALAALSANAHVAEEASQKDSPEADATSDSAKSPSNDAVTPKAVTPTPSAQTAPAESSESSPSHIAETETNATDSPAQQSEQEPSSGAKNDDAAPEPQSSVNQTDTVSPSSVETKTEESSAVKLSTVSPEPVATPQTVTDDSPTKMDVNFGKDEIRTLLVPVSPFHRLIACIIVIFSSSILGYIILKTPAGLNAQGMHTIDLAEPGAYVFFFRGDTQDAYGWAEDGRFRKSLEIDMEPVEPNQKVEKVSPIKDLSGANFFSVAEFEVNQPGQYNVWIKWNDPNAKCIGKIRYEKDPVETFFFKWALGIVGTIAFFYMLGIPMTTRKAQSTLPNSSPPVVAK